MNKYEINSYSFFKKFCLLFNWENNIKIFNIKYNKKQYWVRILSGLRIILIFVHNLIYKEIKGKEIFFNPISKDDFNLCNNIISYKYYIPEDYISYYK